MAGKASFCLWQGLYQGYTLWAHVDSVMAGAVNEVEHCLYHHLAWGRTPSVPFKEEWQAYGDPERASQWRKQVGNWTGLVGLHLFFKHMEWGAFRFSEFVVERGAYIQGGWLTRCIWPYTGKPVLQAASYLKGRITSSPGAERVPSPVERRLFQVFQYALRGVVVAYDLLNWEGFFLAGAIEGLVAKYNQETGKRLAADRLANKPEGEDLESGVLDEICRQVAEAPAVPTPMDQELDDFMNPKVHRVGLVSAKIAGLAIPLVLQKALEVGGRGLSPLLENSPYLLQLFFGLQRAGSDVNRRFIYGRHLGMQSLPVGQAVEAQVHEALRYLLLNSPTGRLCTWLNS